MNSAFGFIGKNFALLVSDIIASKSLVNQKNDMDKIIEIGNKKMLIISGNSGDISNFVDFVQKTIQLYALKTGYSLVSEPTNFFL
jgi:20S proteasome alpha/beta subunit